MSRQGLLTTGTDTGMEASKNNRPARLPVRPGSFLVSLGNWAWSGVSLNRPQPVNGINNMVSGSKKSRGSTPRKRPETSQPVKFKTAAHAIGPNDKASRDIHRTMLGFVRRRLRVTGLSPPLHPVAFLRADCAACCTSKAEPMPCLYRNCACACAYVHTVPRTYTLHD